MPRTVAHTVDSSQYLGAATSALLLISTLTFGFAVAAVIEVSGGEGGEGTVSH